MSADRAMKLIVAEQVDEVSVLIAEGVLDSGTYRPLRDAIIKAAVDGSRAVIVDMTRLVVPAPSALSVFTSARWHISQWPAVPMALVCAHAQGRHDLARTAVTRYVPVYPTSAQALAALKQCGSVEIRHRSRTELPRVSASVSRSRDVVAEYLTAWSQTDLISAAKLIATILVENVLAHTKSAPVLRLESRREWVTVAVEDESGKPAARRESPSRGVDDVSGLAIVAALSRKWGNSPTLSGKTVWAVLGPEDRLSDQ